jgi:hypothetical protein
LILKEKLDNGIVSSWFGDKEFLKYLKIHILQSTSAKLTNLLATKSISLNSVRDRTLNRLDKEEERKKLKFPQDAVYNVPGCKVNDNIVP